MQLSFKNFNLACTIDFFNNSYEYIINKMDDSFDQVRDKFIDCAYEESFSFNELVHFIYGELKGHSSLKNDRQPVLKKKRYKMIANLCLNISITIIVWLAIYVFWTKDTVNVKPSFILVLIIPIILWLIFDAKSVKQK